MNDLTSQRSNHLLSARINLTALLSSLWLDVNWQTQMCLEYESYAIYTTIFSSCSALNKDYTVWQPEHSQDAALSQASQEEQKSFSFCYFREKGDTCQGTWVGLEDYRNGRDCRLWPDICLLREHHLLRMQCGWMSIGRRVNKC